MCVYTYIHMYNVYASFCQYILLYYKFIYEYFYLHILVFIYFIYISASIFTLLFLNVLRSKAGSQKVYSGPQPPKNRTKIYVEGKARLGGNKGPRF